MNLKLLKQLNKDSNGKVISLLTCFISEGLELCFYTKGVMPGILGIDDFEGEHIGNYVEYAGETDVADFYSMLGLKGWGYSFEVDVFDDGRANEADDTENYFKAHNLKECWVPAGAMIQAIPELFMNITQHGERDKDYEGTIYHNLGITWKVNGPKLLLDKNALKGVIRELEIAEEEHDPWYYNAGCGVPSRFAI